MGFWTSHEKQFDVTYHRPECSEHTQGKCGNHGPKQNLAVTYVVIFFFKKLCQCVIWQLRPMWSMFSHGWDNFQKLILTHILLGRLHDLGTWSTLSFILSGNKSQQKKTPWLTVMVSIMVNKYGYKPSLHDFMTLRSTMRWYAWIWVCKWGPLKFLGILSM